MISKTSETSTAFSMAKTVTKKIYLVYGVMFIDIKCIPSYQLKNSPLSETLMC